MIRFASVGVAVLAATFATCSGAHAGGDDGQEAVGFVIENAPLKLGARVSLAVGDTGCVARGTIGHRTARGNAGLIWVVRATSLKCPSGAVERPLALEGDVEPAMRPLPNTLVRGTAVPLGVPLATIVAPSSAMLEVGIEPSAAPGDMVTLRDGPCRYVGQLVRKPAKEASVATSLVQRAGSDTGQWAVAITRRACEAGDVEEVKMHVNLPRPPSLTGGGGLPPAPRGYQAGATFALQAD